MVDLHLFAESQPDLNWDNPEVREAVYDVIEFWAKKGTDGFRVCNRSIHRLNKTNRRVSTQLDVINLISKISGLPDAPITAPDRFEQYAIQMFTNGWVSVGWKSIHDADLIICRPKVHEYIHEMNLKVLSRYNCCTVGEMPCGVSQFEASQYVGKDRRELSMVFQFDHMDLDGEDGNKWKPRKFELPELERVMRIWQQHMLGNQGTYWYSYNL